MPLLLPYNFSAAARSQAWEAQQAVVMALQFGTVLAVDLDYNLEARRYFHPVLVQDHPQDPNPAVKLDSVILALVESVWVSHLAQ